MAGIGRRSPFKAGRPKGHVGSTPTSGISALAAMQQSLCDRRAQQHSWHHKAQPTCVPTYVRPSGAPTVSMTAKFAAMRAAVDKFRDAALGHVQLVCVVDPRYSEWVRARDLRARFGGYVEWSGGYLESDR